MSAGRRWTTASRRSWLAVTVLLIALAGGNGCIAVPSMAVVPRDWREHQPWGPEANAARAAGELPDRRCPAALAPWAAFGQQHLQDGDIVFRRGHCGPLEHWIASFLISELCASPFAHDGIIGVEHGRPWVYDMAEGESVRKMPFEVWMLDTRARHLAVKRLKPDYRDRIPQVLAFCAQAYVARVPFDRALSVGDDSFYCSELVERAFSSAGLRLSAPVPICCLPHYRQYQWLAPVAKRVAGIDTDTPVYVAGNACFGTYSSPLLELVYEHDHATRILTRSEPPHCTAAGSR